MVIIVVEILGNRKGTVVSTMGYFHSSYEKQEFRGDEQFIAVTLPQMQSIFAF